MYTKRKSTKALSVFSLVMINIIAIDSLRNLPANAAKGYPILSYYLIAALLFLLPCALITAELATRYPEKGGVYVWVREAFGKRVAFFTIWLQWIYNVTWYPTILLFLATNIAYFIYPQMLSQPGFLPPRTILIAMVIGLFFIASVVNNFGMVVSGFLSSLSAIIGTLVPMAILITIGAQYWLANPNAVPQLTQFLPSTHISNNIAFFNIVIFSLMGLEMSAVHANDVKNPQKEFPKALKYSGIIIATSLTVATLAIVAIVPPNQMNIITGMGSALNLFLQKGGHSGLFFTVIAMIIIGAFGGMAAWVIGPAKALLVSAEDGLLPAWFSQTNRHQAPTRILITQFIIVIILSGLYALFQDIQTPYEILSIITGILALLFYIFFFAAAIKLRYKDENNNTNTYRIPGKNNRGTWIVGGVGILICTAVILVSFIPTSNITPGNRTAYEISLIVGTVLFTVLPLIIMRKKK
jgi:glutamate:GABA antiporter